MRTSDHLAEAARRVGELLRDGQHDLLSPDDGQEVRLTVHLRDQVIEQLSSVLTRAVAHLGDPPAAQDAEALLGSVRARRAGLAWSGPAGTAPTDLSARPPATRTARAWAAAGAQLEAAVVQASRAEQAGQATWRAVIADVAALATGVTWADVDLGRVVAWAGRHAGPDLQLALPRLLEQGLAEVRRDATAVLAHGSGPGVPRRGYHLPGPVEGVSAVTEPGLIPVAIRRAGALLEHQGAVTRQQQRALHTAAAAVAARLGRYAAAGGQMAAGGWQAAAEAQLRLGAAWHRADHFWCVQPGSWDAVAQLHAAAEAAQALRPGQLNADQLLQSAAGLATLTATARRALDTGLAREQWLARRDDVPGQWVTVMPIYEETGTYRFPNVTGTLIDQRLARLAAGAPVASWSFPGADGSQDLGSVAARAVTDLHRIRAAQQIAVTAAQQAAGATPPAGPRPSARPVTEPTARDVLASLAHPALPEAGQTSARRVEAANATSDPAITSPASTSARLDAATSRSTTVPDEAQIDVHTDEATRAAGNSDGPAQGRGRSPRTR